MNLVKRCPERGSAMLLTMIVSAALMAGAAALVSVQLHSTRNSGLTRSSISSVHCAEAGLAAARAAVAANYAQWNATLGQSIEPSWLAAIDHDLDGDGVADFAITLRDNDDDTPADPAHDNDLSVFVVATCTKYPETPTEISELVRFNGGGNCYQAQLGGCGGNANAN